MKNFNAKTRVLTFLLSLSMLAGDMLPAFAAYPAAEPSHESEEQSVSVSAVDPVQADTTVPDTDDEEDFHFVPGYIDLPDDFPVVDNSISYTKARSLLVDGAEDEYYSTYERVGASVESAYPTAYNGEWLSYLTNKFPATRNQGNYGTCWAHSAMALAEFDLASQGVSVEECSELHLAYWSYVNGTPSAVAGDTGDKVQFTPTTEYKNILDNGGNLKFVAQTLMRQRGVALESTVPYSQADSVAAGNALNSSTERNDKYYLNNAYEINIKSNAAQVKEAIKAHGAVGVSFFAANESNIPVETYYNSTNNCYYCYDQTKTNHAVAVVGWDDDYPKTNFNSDHQPANNGAWLVRNSWSTDTSAAYNSYFWLSYEDTSLSGAWVFEFVTDFPYDNHYYYDSQIHGSGYYSSDSVKNFANVYTINGDSDYQRLEAVDFEVSAVNGNEINYTINVYKNPVLSKKEGKNSDGEVVVYYEGNGDLIEEATKTGTLVYVGQYTVPLKSPVLLEKGDKILIEIVFDQGNCSIAIEKPNANFGAVTISPSSLDGQSYYSNYDGTLWWDLGTDGNLVISALTNNVSNIEDQSSISLSPQSLSFTEKDKTANITASVKDKLGNTDTSTAVTFTSSNPEVASVTGSGQSATVTALSSGTTTITAEANGKSASCEVTVSIKAATPTSDKESDSSLIVGQEVALSCETEGATIYYTTDGTTPTESSTKYTEAVKTTEDMIDSGLTIKAIAIADGYAASDVATFTYTVSASRAGISLDQESLEFTSIPDTKQLKATVRDANGDSLSTATVSWESADIEIAAVVRSLSSLQTANVTSVSKGSTTITARATIEGIEYSASCDVTVTPEQLAKPEATPKSGNTLSIGQKITLSCSSNVLASIYYTTNGTEPTKDSTLYSAETGIIVPKEFAGKTLTIKAFAMMHTGIYDDSEVATFTYDVSESAARVEIFDGNDSVSEDGISLYPQDTKTLTAKVFDEAGAEDSTATVSWNSSWPLVASVDDDGTITAHSKGTTRITAESNGLSTSCIVTVEESKAELKLSVSEMKLTREGETAEITAEVKNTRGESVSESKINWVSLKPSVARVDNGTVTAVDDGEAVITATSEYGSVSSCTVTVEIAKTEAPQAGIEDGAELNIGDKITLTSVSENAKIFYTLNGEDPTTESTLYNNGITVTKDMFTTEPVTLKAIAKAEGYKSSEIVTVSFRIKDQSALTLDRESYTFVSANETLQLLATAYGVDGLEDKSAEISWSSSDTSVVTVDANTGIVKPEADGTATVTATYNKEITAECLITVDYEKVRPEAKSISADSIVIDRSGLTADLDVKVLDENGDEIDAPNLSFISEDTSIATVNAKGEVTGVSTGSTFITISCGALSKNCEVTVCSVISFNNGITQKEFDGIVRGSAFTDKYSTDDIPATSEGFLGWYDESGTKWDAASPVFHDTVLTAKYADKMKDEASAFNPVPDLQEETLYLVKGQSVTIPTATKAWTGGTKGIAVVNKSGKLTAKGAGTTTIKNEEDKKEYAVNVIVPTLDKKSQTLLPGEEADITLSLKLKEPDISAHYPVSWVSSAPGVAGVEKTDSGCHVYAISKGSAKITAYVNGKTYTATIKVAETKKAAITAANTELNLSAFQTVTLSLNGENFKNVKWSSNKGMEPVANGKKTDYHDDVVYITSAGKLTAIGTGTTMLKREGSDMTIKVTVKEPTERALYISAGKKSTLKFSGVKNAKATWSCPDTTGIIDKAVFEAPKTGGTVKGLKAGSVVVSCFYNPYGYEDTGFNLTTRVYVENTALQTDAQLSMNKNNQYSYLLNMDSGSSYSLKFKQEGEYSEYEPVVFKSNKAAVAYVDEYGIVHAAKVTKKTSVTLSCTIGGKKTTIKLTVNPE